MFMSSSWWRSLKIVHWNPGCSSSNGLAQSFSLRSSASISDLSWSWSSPSSQGLVATTGNLPWVVHPFSRSVVRKCSCISARAGFPSLIESLRTELSLTISTRVTFRLPWMCAGCNPVNPAILEKIKLILNLLFYGLTWRNFTGQWLHFI